MSGRSRSTRAACTLLRASPESSRNSRRSHAPVEDAHSASGPPAASNAASTPAETADSADLNGSSASSSSRCSTQVSAVGSSDCRAATVSPTCANTLLLELM